MLPEPCFHSLTLMNSGIIIIIILEYEEKLHRCENLEGTRHEGCAHHSGTSWWWWWWDDVLSALNIFFPSDANMKYFLYCITDRYEAKTPCKSYSTYCRQVKVTSEVFGPLGPRCTYCTWWLPWNTEHHHFLTVKRPGWIASRNPWPQHISLPPCPPHKNIIRFHIHSPQILLTQSPVLQASSHSDTEHIIRLDLTKQLLLRVVTHTLRYEDFFCLFRFFFSLMFYELKVMRCKVKQINRRITRLALRFGKSGHVSVIVNPLHLSLAHIPDHFYTI